MSRRVLQRFFYLMLSFCLTIRGHIYANDTDQWQLIESLIVMCGTLKCENAAMCEKVAKCETNSTLNVKIDAICEKITLNVKNEAL